MASKKKENKTTPQKDGVKDYLNSLPSESARTQAQTLLALFEDCTGKPAVLWGDSLVGFGSYHYRYDSGREGDFLATGFSIRKSGPTIYIMPGYENYSALLKDLGPHKLGKSCLYLKSLDDVDLKVLTKLIKTGLQDLKKHYPVT